jgi:hypothetical protein
MQPAARKQPVRATSTDARKNGVPGRTAQADSYKSFQIMVGILIVVALVMLLLGSTPKWQASAPAGGVRAWVSPTVPIRQATRPDILP